jgi:hypothetical protein
MPSVWKLPEECSSKRFSSKSGEAEGTQPHPNLQTNQLPMALELKVKVASGPSWLIITIDIRNYAN